MSLSGDVIVDFEKIEESKIIELFKKRKSFIVENVPRLSMTEVVEKIEKLIDGCGMRSRVYAKGRSAGMAGSFIPTPLTAAVGLGTAAFIAGHTVATFNPDYEIGTNRATGSLTITYTKWESVSEVATKVGDEVSAFASKIIDKVRR